MGNTTFNMILNFKKEKNDDKIYKNALTITIVRVVTIRKKNVA